MEYPRILIISHNCFSDFGSNGRTLANFFVGYPTEKLAQFYIYNEKPNVYTSNNYYRVTDKDAIKSIIKTNSGSKIDVEQNNESLSSKSARAGIKRTPAVYFLRELLWKFGRWDNKNLENWIDEFNPQVVLFQAGDAAFLFDFAYKTAKKRSIPLVIYNSESYYFKDKNYLPKSFGSNFSYRILHRYFKRHAGRAIKSATQSIYISDMLKETYDREFKMPSTTVMTSTALLNTPYEDKNEKISISYLGNLGVGRDETLIELADILRKIDENLYIDVYGNASEKIENKFKTAQGINYCGFVSYDECVRIMKSSTILVHIENFSEFYLEDSKYAFSTKIADSLACGTSLFLYAPKEISCTEYLLKNNAACVACTQQEAYAKLKLLIEDKKLRNQYEEQGRKIALENHSIDINRKKFINVICSAEGLVK